MQACQRDGLAQRKLRTIKRAVPMPEQYHPRGVTMRDCFSNRGGFDRVVVAVATSAGLVSEDLAGAGGAAAAVALKSILKSLAVGGGTLAGSGRGIAASIASSAALLRA